MSTPSTPAGHVDALLDHYFPRIGPCLLCGVPGEDQRHRVVDAVAGRFAAGDDLRELADDYNIPIAAVYVAALHHEINGGPP